MAGLDGQHVIKKLAHDHHAGAAGMVTVNQMANELGITPDEVTKRVNAGLLRRFRPTTSNATIAFPDEALILAKRCRRGSLGVAGVPELDGRIVAQEFLFLRGIIGDRPAIRRIGQAYNAQEPSVERHLNRAGIRYQTDSREAQAA
ncbi:hypothetical protein [Corynebacterium cystitidis]|uniref:hypothetical protein n=1 Tax=Corynebacterium cystitidis TaxID=35757 RepID=UPI00211E10CD|nr:hypothetical protein [Corynebacterium cystitidis]